MNWAGTCSRLRKNVALRTLYLLLLGQVVSFLLALTSICSSLLANLGVDAPFTQACITYLFLALVYGSILLHRRQKPLVSWYWYLLVAFLEVHGVYLFNKAYQFTSVTSVSILECFSIAWVMMLTWFFLGTRYSLWQFFGAAIGILGLCVVLLSDVGVGGGGGSRPLWGDILVIVGTVLNSLSSVGEEFCVKNKDHIELMFMIGVFGFLVSIVEIPIVELKSLESAKLSADIILALAGYALSSFTLYSLFFWFLKLSGATMYNLSILTSNMWVVVMCIFFYHQQVDWLYYLAFAIVTVGLIIYSTTEKDPDSIPAVEDENFDAEYQVLTDGNTASKNEFGSIKGNKLYSTC